MLIDNDRFVYHKYNKEEDDRQSSLLVTSPILTWEENLVQLKKV